MLTLEETRWSLNIFKVYSILNIIPIQVDVKNGKIQRQSSKIRVFIWKILFGIAIFHWFYMFARLVESTVIEPEKYFRWDRFILHFSSAFIAGVFYFTAFSLFVTNAEENVIIFNQLFKQREDPVQKMMDRQLQTQMPSIGKRGNTARGKSGNGNQPFSASAKGQNQNRETHHQSRTRVPPRPLLTWPPQYSLDELMAKLLPLSVVASGSCNILILHIDPGRPQLLYSSLPPEYQNLQSFFTLLLVEVLWVVIFLSSLVLASVIQILFFGNCQLEFTRLSLQLRNVQEKFQNGVFGVRQIETEVWILRQILEEMRELVVLIELFNRCFPFCIFAWKICSLSLSIVFYFFVIRHFGDFPIIGGFIGYLAFIVTFMYTVMYGHAFSIPGKMDELKNEFLLTAQKTIGSNGNSNWNQYGNGNQILWTEMKRQVKRIRGVGVKVGSFNQMERQSTPNFIDFVLRNVVTLLVTIPR